jgi:hypothetical protein
MYAGEEKNAYLCQESNPNVQTLTSHYEYSDKSYPDLEIVPVRQEIYKLKQGTVGFNPECSLILHKSTIRQFYSLYKS